VLVLKKVRSPILELLYADRQTNVAKVMGEFLKLFVMNALKMDFTLGVPRDIMKYNLAF
jgi:hypothetical protein